MSPFIGKQDIQVTTLHYPMLIPAHSAPTLKAFFLVIIRVDNIQWLEQHASQLNTAALQTREMLEIACIIFLRFIIGGSKLLQIPTGAVEVQGTAAAPFRLSEPWMDAVMKTRLSTPGSRL